MKRIVVLTFFLVLTKVSSILAGDLLFINDSISYDVTIKNLNEKSVKFIFEKQNYEMPTSEVFAILFKDASKNNNVIANESEAISNLGFKNKITSKQVFRNYMSSDNDEECIKAQEDAQELHFSNSKLWFHKALGFVLPGISIAGTAILAKPKLADAKFLHLSENKELHNNPDYIKCYEKRAKNELIMQEVIGTSVALLALLAVITLK